MDRGSGAAEDYSVMGNVVDRVLCPLCLSWGCKPPLHALFFQSFFFLSLFSILVENAEEPKRRKKATIGDRTIAINLIFTKHFNSAQLFCHLCEMDILRMRDER